MARYMLHVRQCLTLVQVVIYFELYTVPAKSLHMRLPALGPSSRLPGYAAFTAP